MERDRVRLVPEPIEDHEAVLAEEHAFRIAEMEVRVDAVVEARCARAVPRVALHGAATRASALPFGAGEVRGRDEAGVGAGRRLVRDVAEAALAGSARARKGVRSGAGHAARRDGQSTDLPLLLGLGAPACSRGTVRAPGRARAGLRARVHVARRAGLRARDRS